jgi:hypothetical protein
MKERASRRCAGKSRRILVMRVGRAVLVAAIVFLPVRVLAQPAAPSVEVNALRAEIESDFAVTERADCSLACRALDSMRRATDRLCALDPGDACADARAKVRRSTERVRSACGDCPASLDIPTGQAEEEGKRKLTPSQPAEPTAVNTATPPEAAPRKGGGCAGCASVGHGEGPEFGLMAPFIAALTIVWGRSRRRRYRRFSGARSDTR